MKFELKVPVCTECGEKWIIGERYCRYCGAKKRRAKFASPDYACIYGPMPVERIHICENCGHKWMTCLMADLEEFCPKCGGNAPAKEATPQEIRKYGKKYQKKPQEKPRFKRSIYGCIDRLKAGNECYLHSRDQIGDISENIRKETADKGQHPFAIILTCSDSRVIPEAIFSCGIGELFVIRTAGNIVDDTVLGSIEYAVEHLGCPFIIVLGHTGCGAVGAAIAGENGGYVRCITEKIARAIRSETDPDRASIINIRSTISDIREAFFKNEELSEADVIGALYDIRTGVVDFLD